MVKGNKSPDKMPIKIKHGIVFEADRRKIIPQEEPYIRMTTETPISPKPMRARLLQMNVNENI